MGNSSPETILVIFPEEWIAYAPSILNYYELASKQGKVVYVLAIKSEINTENLENSDSFFFLKISRLEKIILNKIGLLKIYKLIKLVAKVKKILKTTKVDTFIAVDSVGALAAQFSGIRKYIYWSLEAERDVYIRCLDLKRISLVISQSLERLEYIFGNYSGKKLLIPNSPILKNPVTGKLKCASPRRLIFLGTAIPSHGVFRCLEYMKITNNTVLTLKWVSGPNVESEIRRRYSALLKDGTLQIDKNYIDQENLPDYLRLFDIGFCLYDMTKPGFNYFSSPSGKLFNYYSAALPVIGSNYLGLKSIEEFNAGIIVNRLDADSIENAVKKITDNYSEYSRGAARAANFFDFKIHALPLLNKGQL